MNTYIVSVAVANGNPDFPSDVTFYAVNASTRDEAMASIKEVIRIPMLAIGCCLKPRSWPEGEGARTVL